MKRWDENTIELLLNNFNEGKTYSEIGLLLNRSASSIKNKLNRLGLKYTDINKSDIDYVCIECNKKFSGKTYDNRLFCSRSCSVSFNNRISPKRNKIIKYCKNCNLELKKRNTIYCSQSCHIEYRKNEIFERIENGDTSFYETQYKKYLIFKYGNKCMECGWCEINPTTGLIPIQLEHIDGNSENNNLNNLKLLCPNCHSLTPTYGALNKGNGRKKRREKRQKEKLINYAR